MTVGAPAAVATDRAEGKPVIGRPVAVPPLPVAGERFTVSFRVTRSDTGAPLARGTMICDPSIAGRTLRHAESFRRGTARLSFVVPARAAGKQLKVKVTIRAGSRSATRVAAFRIQGTPSLSIGDASVAEGNGGSTMLTFPVTLSASAAKTVSVGYATTDGTASSSSDYAATSGTLTFGPGEKAKTVSVEVAGDTMIEQDETFTMTITNPVNAPIARATATGTITNDDSVTSGPYRGATENGKSVLFWVTREQTVKNFRIVALPCSCDGPVRVTGGQDLRDSTVPIFPDGSFAGEGSWDGSLVQGNFELTHWDIKVTGAFATTTSVTGTFIVKYELNYKGTHYRCTSGVVKWSATLQS